MIHLSFPQRLCILRTSLEKELKTNLDKHKALKKDDKNKSGLFIFGYFFPLVELISFLIWRKINAALFLIENEKAGIKEVVCNVRI